MKAVIFSLFDKLIQKRWLLRPGKKTHDVLQRGRKAKKIQEYYYIKYATSALRAIAWIILVLGVIGSIFWGITTGGIGGGFRIVMGILGSFLVWLLLLATRELIYLFIHLEEDTRSTAESIIEESR